MLSPGRTSPRLVRQRRGRSVLITRFPKSPGGVYADVVLQCGSTEGPIQGGSVAARGACPPPEQAARERAMARVSKSASSRFLFNGISGDQVEIVWWAFPTFGVDSGYEQELADAFMAANSDVKVKDCTGCRPVCQYDFQIFFSFFQGFVKNFQHPQGGLPHLRRGLRL